MKNKAYFLLIAIAIAGTILFLDLYNILQNNAIKIIGLLVAGGFVLSYMFVRYSKKGRKANPIQKISLPKFFNKNDKTANDEKSENENQDKQ